MYKESYCLQSFTQQTFPSAITEQARDARRVMTPENDVAAALRLNVNTQLDIQSAYR